MLNEYYEEIRKEKEVTEDEGTIGGETIAK